MRDARKWLPNTSYHSLIHQISTFRVAITVRGAVCPNMVQGEKIRPNLVQPLLWRTVGGMQLEIVILTQQALHIFSEVKFVKFKVTGT